jgi:hypothetical protein
MLSEHARWIGEIIARAAEGDSTGAVKPARRRQEATTASARTVSTA